MKSGSAPGVPLALDTRATMSDDGIGSPRPAGATRSMTPSANTPTGWKIRLARIADPHWKGNATRSEMLTGGGFRSQVTETTMCALRFTQRPASR